MIYKNEALAKKAAKEFLDTKVEDGCWVRLWVKGGILKVAYCSTLGGPIESNVFEFTPLPKLDRDQKIWVRSDGGYAWWRRHATGEFNENGWVGCYDRGGTSFTETVVKYWPEYSLTDPDETDPIEEDLPDVEKDQLVWVRNWEDSEWVKRFATGKFNEIGWIYCYYDGKTSYASFCDDFGAWKYYSLTDPDERKEENGEEED